MPYEVTVDHDKCEGCEECVEVCPVDVYEMQDESPIRSTPKNALAARAA